MSEAKKVAWVTGASRGIGCEVLRQLGAAGYVVAGTATSEAGVASIQAMLAEHGFEGGAYCMNLLDDSSISGCYKQISADLGVPGILVNNAGITRDALFLRMKENNWMEVIGANLNGVFHTSKLALRGMFKARWGRIINITSVVANMGNLGQCNYAAAKGGVLSLTKSLAREMATSGITVNCVSPGLIETDMTAAINEDYLVKMLSAIPMGRMGKPEDVAHVVCFLASMSASYITGETIQVNGGMLMD